MNEEKKQQLFVFLKFLIIFICAGLYAWGGMEMKWLRRFLAPSIAVGTMFAFTRDWRCFIQLPLWFGGLSLGYGADSLGGKILRRGIFGLANGIVSSGKNLSDAIRGDKVRYVLVGFQILLLISAYIAFGVWNPFNSARAEEFILGVFMFLIPILGANKKED